nr:hypothetical protein CFP56_64704 [Quercus suber]
MFQLWAALFTSPEPLPRRSRIERSLSTSMINVFCFTKSAFFVNVAGPISRRYHNERSFQRNLQNAELIADIAMTHLSGTKLHQMLIAKQSDFFVLLLTGEDLGSTEAPVCGKERSIAVFVNSFPEVPLRIQQDDNERPAAYVWRSSVMQLQPSFFSKDCGGTGARVHMQTVDLFSHGKVNCRSTNVAIDFHAQTITVDGLDTSDEDALSDGATAEDRIVSGHDSINDHPLDRMRMSLKSFQCYRIPGDSISWKLSSPIPIPTPIP